MRGSKTDQKSTKNLVQGGGGGGGPPLPQLSKTVQKHEKKTTAYTLVFLRCPKLTEKSVFSCTASHCFTILQRTRQFSIFTKKGSFFARNPQYICSKKCQKRKKVIFWQLFLTRSDPPLPPPPIGGPNGPKKGP